MCPARAIGPKPIRTRCGKPRRWCRRGFATTSRRGIRLCAMASRSTTAATSGSHRRYWRRCGRPRPQAGRERTLLRACIHVAKANLRLRVGKPHAAARLFGEALSELNLLGERKAITAGDGFVEGFPTAALARLLKAKLELAMLSKADWIAIAVMGRT